MRSVLALALTLGLVGATTPPVSAAPVVPAAPTGPASQEVAAPSYDMGPHLTHNMFIVLLTDLGAHPPVNIKTAQDTVQQAGDYWLTQARGYFHSFDVVDTQILEAGNPCSAFFNNSVEHVWDLAAGRFRGVSFDDSNNHLVVILPANCDFRTQGKSTRGTNIQSGGKILVSDLDFYGLVKHLGHNMSLDEEGYAYEVGGKLEPVQGLPFGPTGHAYTWSSTGVLLSGYEPGMLDVALAEKHFGRTLGGATHVGPRSSIDLPPVTEPGAIPRSAKFVDPVSGDEVWVEYRDGKRADAGAEYSSGAIVQDFLARSVPVAERERCWAEFGNKAPECAQHHHYRPGVRVYHVTKDGTVTTIGLPQGLGSSATLTPGDMLVGPGGGYSVGVSSLTDKAATVHVRVGDGVGEWPEVPGEPEPGEPGEPQPGEPGTPDDTVPAEPGGLIDATLTVPTSSSTFGTPVELDVDVVAAEQPTGEVAVLQGSKTLATAAVANGAASLTLPAKLAVGTHEVTVRYGGSDRVAPAEASATVRVRKATPQVAVKAPTAVRGKRTKITVTASAGLPANGKVAVFLNGKKRKTLKLSGGKATYRLPKKLAVGKHKVQVRHLGNARYAKSRVTTTVRVWRSVAKVKGFATGTQRVKARGVYRDTVRLSAKGVLQRKTAKGWKRVARVAAGRSAIKVRAGKAGSVRKYRVVIQKRGHVKGVRTKALAIRAR